MLSCCTSTAVVCVMSKLTTHVLRCAAQDPRARLEMAAKSLEIKHPAFHGLIDAQCAATGSVPAAALSGDLRVSRGSVIASGTFSQVLFLPTPSA